MRLLKNNFFKNVTKVALSNITTILAGAIAGFLLPKIIGVTNYGYYKTFSLYISYVSIFQFGIMEGIYLKFGGIDYDKLDKKLFRFYSRFLILLEFFTSLIFVIISLLVFNNDYQFIFLCVSLFLLFQNITTYYQYISQITSRFNELSIRNILKSILTIISVAGMWVYYHFYSKIFLSYKIYTILYCIIFAILTIWYIFTYKDITFGEKIKRVDIKENETIFSLLKIGFPLLMSNLCTTIIFAIDRQFVSLLFDIDTYGSYSFAYNMLQLVTVAASSISTVIYPSLKKYNKEKLIDEYSHVISAFTIFMLGCCLVYFPLKAFIPFFFASQSKYVDSLPIFRIILPSLAISCAITVVIHNYYKIFKLNFRYFLIVVTILVLSIITNFIAYYFFKTPSSISIASVIIMSMWNLIVNIYLHIKIKIKFLFNTIYAIVMIMLFYLFSSFNSWWIGMIGYAISFVITTLMFNFKNIKLFMQRFKKNK